MTFRRIFAVLILIFALPARAIEYTDLWWNPAESGWGLTTTHQGNVVFLTIFVFGPDGKAVWFSSPAALSQNDASANPVYAGTLFQNTGGYFGFQFSPPVTVTATAVGTTLFTVTSATTATLSYTVNGAAVNKSLVRQAFRFNDDIVGNFTGGLVAESYSCPFPINGNGNGFERTTRMAITGSAAEIHISADPGCATRGSYFQDGRIGRVEGDYTCSNGDFGTGSYFEIESDRTGITARYILTSISGCVERGHYVGARRLGSP
jgi:hypothetical protein